MNQFKLLQGALKGKRRASMADGSGSDTDESDNDSNESFSTAGVTTPRKRGMIKNVVQRVSQKLEAAKNQSKGPSLKAAGNAVLAAQKFRATMPATEPVTPPTAPAPAATPPPPPNKPKPRPPRAPKPGEPGPPPKPAPAPTPVTRIPVYNPLNDESSLDLMKLVGSAVA